MRSKLHQRRLTERFENGPQLLSDKSKQISVAYVACRNDQETLRRAPQKMGVPEVSIFANHNPTIFVSDSSNFRVRGSIRVRQLNGVNRVVPSGAKKLGKADWKLGINQEFHAALKGVTRFPEAKAPNSSAASKSSRSRSG